MITIIDPARILSMKQIYLGVALCIIAAPVGICAQDNSAGGVQPLQNNVPSNQPSGLLTPPPDNPAASAERRSFESRAFDVKCPRARSGLQQLHDNYNDVKQHEHVHLDPHELR